MVLLIRGLLMFKWQSAGRKGHETDYEKMIRKMLELKKKQKKKTKHTGLDL